MKKYIFLFTTIMMLTLCICFTYSTDNKDAFVFGGYCYYIENDNIYRAPMTDMTGEIELFRKGSLAIYLEGCNLVSLDFDGNIVLYSLISEDEFLFEELEYLSSSEDDDLLLGSLSAKYESNGNPAAISKGNDAGGVSFGAYQFASNAGVPKAFADWCISSDASADIGNRLLTAYKNDGMACGDSFKSEWLEIAKENSNFFLSIQHRYVKEKYYDAIVSRIEKNVPGFDMDIYGIALRNVFWSRSVQHGVGGSYNVITRAFDTLGGFAMQSEELLIRAIYAESGAVVDSGTYPMTGAAAESLGIAGKYMKYYSKNSSAVQISVYKRLNINELSLALDMLEKYGGYEESDGKEYEFMDFTVDEISECSAKISSSIRNYKLKNISEYGFFMGKSLNSLVDIPLFVGKTSDSVISLEKRFSDSLESGTTYYYGAYAFIGDEYITSEIFTFKTLNEVKFKVSYLDYDGTLLYETVVKKGEDTVYVGDSPSRKTNAQFSYDFSGWDHDGKNITSDTIINALYIENDHKWTGKIAAAFSSGDGSMNFPYIISSPEELAYLSQMVEGGIDTRGKFFSLSNDIVLGYGENSEKFTPIGTDGNPFRGCFLGNEHKIIGLKTDYEFYAGLFGVIGGAKIDSLIIENADINGEISGILAAKILDEHENMILNCSFSGVVNGKTFAGGVVGVCSGNTTFFDISFSGSVMSETCGGLFGYLKNTTVQGAACISTTEGKKDDAICASVSDNVCFTNCYYSDTDISSVGKALSDELMKNESSYLGLDFDKIWTMNDECAVLNISKANAFEYFKYGDADGNGSVDIRDSVFLAQHLASWNLILPNNFEKMSDVNGDGCVSILDSVLLAQYLAGWKVSLIK